jgi:hypothetical protein
MFNKLLRFGETFSNVDSNSESQIVKAMNENIRNNPIEKNTENNIKNIMQNIDNGGFDITNQIITEKMEILDVDVTGYSNTLNFQNIITNEMLIKNMTMNGLINQIILKRNIQLKDTKYNAQFKLVRNSAYSNHNQVKEIIQKYFTNNRAIFLDNVKAAKGVSININDFGIMGLNKKEIIPPVVIFLNSTFNETQIINNNETNIIFINCEGIINITINTPSRNNLLKFTNNYCSKQECPKQNCPKQDCPACSNKECPKQDCPLCSNKECPKQDCPLCSNKECPKQDCPTCSNTQSNNTVNYVFHGLSAVLIIVLIIYIYKSKKN